jgi:hypothetical protein
MFSVGTSVSRAKDQSSPELNDRIREQTRASIAYYAAHPDLIDRRLAELDREWDVERWLQLNSSVLSLVGLTLAATRSRKWLALPLVVQGFFLQHGIQGWCPPLPIFRRIGIRTGPEIEAERQALKALRGDFDDARDGGAAIEAARRDGAERAQPEESQFVKSTSDRVPENTGSDVNEHLRLDTEKRVNFYAAHPELLNKRLDELDREWDVERVLETEAPTMTFTGMLLSMALGRKWLALPIFAQSMVLLHSLQGFYPLLPLFRRMGLRTEKEIGAERYALKALRGDFQELRGEQRQGDPAERADRAFEAAQPVQ